MLIVLSPAKTLDYTSTATTDARTRPAFMQHAARLVAILRAQSPAQLATLMKISDPLAQLNAQRYNDWSSRNSLSNSRQAVLAFNGDVYDGLQAGSMPQTQLDYLQGHVRILSGLYGVLRPLDTMQPYRLEMGTRLANDAGADLYAFWGNDVTTALAEALTPHRDQTIVNLASQEYFRAVRPAFLRGKVVTPVFEDWNGGGYKIISFFAKRARGAMARYAASHNIKKAAQLQEFDTDGYAFDEQASDTVTWRFRRRSVN